MEETTIRQRLPLSYPRAKLKAYLLTHSLLKDHLGEAGTTLGSVVLRLGEEGACFTYQLVRGKEPDTGVKGKERISAAHLPESSQPWAETTVEYLGKGVTGPCT